MVKINLLDPAVWIVVIVAVCIVAFFAPGGYQNAVGGVVSPVSSSMQPEKTLGAVSENQSVSETVDEGVMVPEEPVVVEIVPEIQSDEPEPEPAVVCDVETRSIPVSSLNVNYLKLQQQPLYFDGYLKWDHMPILVYIDEESMGKFSYIDEEDTLESIGKAMRAWGEETGGLVEFRRTNVTQCADVYVSWLRPAQFYNLASAGEAIVYGKGSYGDFILANNSEIGMLPMGEEYSSGDIYATFAHELGHVLGLGHSEGTCNLMTSSRSCGSSRFTPMILNTIRAIYSG